MIVLLGMSCSIVPGVARGAVVRDPHNRPTGSRSIPGMSVVLVLLSGIAVLAVWRGSLTTAKAWVVVGVAVGVGAALRVR